MDRALVVALVVGTLQGVFEWLPISSEGNITLYLVVVEGMDPTVAVQLSLFLHAGTGVAACAYYRNELRELLSAVPHWRPTRSFTPEGATLSFLVVGTLSSVVVGLAVYRLLTEIVTELAGGTFVALIGVLLVGTGVIQRVGDDLVTTREEPSLFDAVLVGSLQGVAILPGVSRSGVTAGTLLLRGHEGVDAFRLSFLLSIPAAFGAGVLVLLDVGVPSVSPLAAGVALVTSAVVGYATIGLLLAVVRRVAFWAVAIGLGVLAIVGGIGVGL
ncbi:undecaprenyl-diphosphate phosphatase [Salinigranum salinum]|uniref:undecaprenyl-diphosphate phosphatase n=1 Tax=Salinigranum salinum TaxID=1364937 RepID=UPI0012605E52|nr:undecaprenyl-diphosphate phosphatase [Salinigranum salinum]